MFRSSPLRFSGFQLSGSFLDPVRFLEPAALQVPRLVVEQVREGAVDLGVGRVLCADAVAFALGGGILFLLVEPPHDRLEADAREERRGAPHRARRRHQGVIVGHRGMPHLAVRVCFGKLCLEMLPRGRDPT